MDSTKGQPDEKSSIFDKKRFDKELPWCYAVFLMLNAIVGGASLNLPYVYHKSGGISAALGIQLLICPMMIASLIVMVMCAQRKDCATYQEVIERWIGPSFGMIANIFIFLFLYGLSISFFIVIMDQWQKVEQSVQPYGGKSVSWFLDKRFLGVVSCLILVLPLSFYRKIDSLKHISSLGMLAYVYSVVLVATKYFTGVDGAKTGNIRTKPEHSYDPILVIPNVTLCYQGILQVVLLYGRKENGGKNYLKTIFSSILLSAIFYNTMSIFGFLSFGSCVNADILLSYKPVPEVVVGIIAVVLKLLFTFPILVLILRSVSQTIWERVIKKGAEMSESEELKFRILSTLVWFFSSLSVSLVVPDIDKICSFVGSFISVLSLILPGVCMIKLPLSEPSSRSSKVFGIILGTIFIVFGVCVALLAFVERIIIITSEQKEVHCT